jgi:hypothetical protein
MKPYSRRDFCSYAAALGATALAAPQRIFAQQPALPATLTIESAALAKVPIDSMGLSYESGQLAYPDFFSAENTALVGIFRTLSPAGVLRLGGNLSEFTIWSETEPATAPEPDGLVGPDPGHREPRTFTLTPRSILNLRGFLDATGWRCIYGLNLGGGSLEQALAEGAFVAKTLGPKLICVQFGNEPDLFKHRDRSNAPWTYDEFIARWKSFRAAFREKLPAVPVAGPDTAFNQTWVKQFVKDVPQDVMLLTSHYYPEGPPQDPRMTIDLLLHPGERFESSCRQPLESAKSAGLPFRMAEGNSCYNAGKQGVSDTFAAALWAGDFCLQMAALGCVGVNLHGGANGYYSPIVGSSASGFAVRPEYYGLMLAQQFSGRTLRRTALAAQGVNLTAYAAREEEGEALVALFNKDAREVEVVLSARGCKHATIDRLTAPAIDSKEGVTFQGAAVESNGAFHPRASETVRAHRSKLNLRLPAYSAALVRLD